MKTCVIGHRGVGKTSLLRRLDSAFSESKQFKFTDLDEAIEHRAGKKIFEIFIDHGEKYFRELEQQTFFELWQSVPESESHWFVLGAGFDVSKIPAAADVLWVRRTTDADGRIFLDRPRLDDAVRPLAEYLKRYSEREVKYRQRATWTYILPEGNIDFKKRAFEIEKSIFSNIASSVDAILTLLPEMFINDKWNQVHPHLSGKYKAFELRDDLLSLGEMEQAITALSQEKFIYSYRRESVCILQNGFQADYYDWALELGEPSEDFLSRDFQKRILSLHEGGVLEFEKFRNAATYLKWAPVVGDWSQLDVGHKWFLDDEKHRSFLPRSLDGRWKWYRLFGLGRMFIQFVKESDGSAKDQPTVFEIHMLPNKYQHFAAVLGAPVSHSWSPIEHSDFCDKRSIPFWSIDIKESEFFIAIKFLQKLGLKYAAVTSPLKKIAASYVGSPLDAINTMFFSDNGLVRSTSTDAIGFAIMIEGIDQLGEMQSSVVVWGGGGTLESVEKSLPKAAYYSSRTGLPREGSHAVEDPKAVIWAAPRLNETLMPPSNWKPIVVYDLNYKEDSLGREYAQISRATYESGATMFSAQAQAQQAFWILCEEQK